MWAFLARSLVLAALLSALAGSAYMFVADIARFAAAVAFAGLVIGLFAGGAPDALVKRRSGTRASHVAAAVGIDVTVAVVVLAAVNVIEGDCQVPPVEGEPLARAAAALDREDLEWRQVRRFAERRVGDVVAQDPAGGEKTGCGERVALTVSRGVEVPKVVGTQVGLAVGEIEEAGLGVSIRRHAGPSEPDEVTGQDPRAGEGADPGGTITLRVSDGLPPAGEILAPRSGEALTDPFVARGTLSGHPRAGQRIWLAVRVGTLHFPKEPPLTEERWQVEVSEAAEDFSLVVLLVERADDRAIERWFERGRETGDFPGLALSRAKTLDQVGGLSGGG